MAKGLSGSYIAKMVIVVVEIALSIGFGVTMYASKNNVAGMFFPNTRRFALT